MITGVPSQAPPKSDLGMAVEVLENRHRRETKHSAGAGCTPVFVKLAPFKTDFTSGVRHPKGCLAFHYHADTRQPKNLSATEMEIIRVLRAN